MNLFNSHICFFVVSEETKAIKYFSKKYFIDVIKDPEKLKEYDIILFSLLSFRDFYELIKLEKYKTKNHIFIAGGNACTNPTAITWLMDYIFIGDAFTSFNDIIQGNYNIPGMLNCKTLFQVNYQISTIPKEEITNGEIIVSSGCKRKCFFCVNAWRPKYAEQEKDFVLNYIKNKNVKGLYLISNSSDDVSYYDEMADLLNAHNKTDMIVSNSVSGMKDEYIKTRKREILFGIEGMSERLRNSVNKPIKRDIYREKVISCLNYETQVRTVYQFNLPNERISDFDEFMEDFSFINSKCKSGSWAIPFIPNQISPMTPFQWCKPYYNFETAKKIMKFRQSCFGSNKTGISIYVPSPLYPFNWFKQTLAEWIPITKKVEDLLILCSKKDKNNYYDYIDIFEKNNLSVEFIFKEKDKDYKFPWNNVKTSHSNEELYRYFMIYKNKWGN